MSKSRAERAEVSRRRNRKRGVTHAEIRAMATKPTPSEMMRIRQEFMAGPRFGHFPDASPHCGDRWGGPTPPAA